MVNQGAPTHFQVGVLVFKKICTYVCIYVCMYVCLCVSVLVLVVILKT